MRIGYIVNHIDNCDVLLDVGCDHGKMSKLALDRNICQRVIATDLSEACLAKAKKLLRDYKNAEFITCDGIPKETCADFILICGMGGHTIAGIIAGYYGGAKLLISPQSHGEIVREQLMSMGYEIVFDTCFVASGKYYDLIKAERTGVLRDTDRLHIKYGMFFEQQCDALKGRMMRMQSKLKPGSEKYAEISEVLSWQK